MKPRVIRPFRSRCGSSSDRRTNDGSPALLETHIRNRFRVQPNHANDDHTRYGGDLAKRRED